MSVKRVFGRGDLTSIVRLLVVVAGAVVTLWVLAATGALDSNDAPAWVAAVGTVGLVIVAGAQRQACRVSQRFFVERVHQSIPELQRRSGPPAAPASSPGCRSNDAPRRFVRPC